MADPTQSSFFFFLKPWLPLIWLDLNGIIVDFLNTIPSTITSLCPNLSCVTVWHASFGSAQFTCLVIIVIITVHQCHWTRSFRIVRVLRRNRTYIRGIYISSHEYGGWQVLRAGVCKVETQESWWCHSVQGERLENQGGWWCKFQSKDRRGLTSQLKQAGRKQKGWVPLSSHALNKSDDAWQRWGRQSSESTDSNANLI